MSTRQLNPILCHDFAQDDSCDHGVLAEALADRTVSKWKLEEGGGRIPVICRFEDQLGLFAELFPEPGIRIGAREVQKGVGSRRDCGMDCPECLTPNISFRSEVKR